LIKNRKKIQKLERELIQKQKVDVQKNFRILEALYKEARLLGAFPPKDSLSGLEIDLKIAKVVNSVSKAS
jgi:hypothetical protein